MGLVATALALSPLATAQEELAPILERGYIAHWLVCGPFPSDVPGGILGAVQSNAGVLGDTDFMAGLGGIARTRPEHLMRVATPEGGEAIWQRAGTTDAELDLKPFFPASPSGIAYAAFYTLAARPSAIFLDIQSPLGVRLWVNGFPARDYEAAPMEEAGVTEVVASLRAGSNLVVMEVPGADYEALARALGQTTEELTAGTMANRPRLRKTSGFALSAHVRAAQPLGALFVVPQLEDLGTLSGKPGDTRQDTRLILHNPADAQSAPVDVLVSTPGSTLPELIEVEPIDATSTTRVSIPVPVQGLAEGAQVAVNIRLHSAGAEAAFTSNIRVRSGADQPGIVRVITGHTIHTTPGDPASERATPYLNSFRNQILFAREGGGYGFDLGYPSEWHLPYVAFPELRQNLLTAAQQGAATVRGPYAPVDERIASGLLLWRNLQLGLRMDQGLLASATPQYLAWHAPGIAPQTAQLLQFTPLRGMVTDIPIAGLPALGQLWDLNGGTRYLRRKLSGSGPVTSDDLMDKAAVQRRELLELGISTDVLVIDNVVPAPEPFYRGSVTELARSFPRVVLDSSGSSGFFEEVATLESSVQAAIPPVAPYLNTGQPGDLLTWPVLKAAHTETSRLLADAETLATLATFHGATYPHAAMEFASRQLAFYSTPAYLSAPTTRDDILDTLAGYREVASLARASLGDALKYIADKTDTAGSVPLNQGAFNGIVVFNPLSQVATLPVAIHIAQSASTLSLFNADEAPVPFATRPYQGGTLIEFMATDMPSLGYQTYFYKTDGVESVAVPGTELQIENEFLALFLDPETGAIASLLDKRTNTQVNAGLLNQILFLDDDESRNDGGRELWTSPAAAPPEKPADITSEHTAFHESIVVQTETRGGRLEQRYTLRAGQPWVECDTRMMGIDLRGRAAVAAFSLPSEGRSFVAGERFGGIVGARGQANERIQTQKADNAKGVVPYPAHEWAAVTPADAIQVGPDGAVPWEPAIIVHGPEQILEKAARDLQAALFSRGIPALLHAFPPTKPDFLWSDSTAELESNEYLRRGYRMRVVVGSPDQNGFCQPLLAQLSTETVTAFTERITQGARVFLYDEKVPDGIDPVPTLMLAGLTPTQSASLLDTVTDAVRAGRNYLLPPSSYAARTPAQLQTSGCALLLPGSMGVSQQHDGRLLLGLAHRAELEKNATGSRLTDMMPEQRFRYALFPFQGSWRSADVPAAAAAAFATAHATQVSIHPGGLPVRQSYFGVSNPGLQLTGIKPAGFPQTTNTRGAFHTRDGVTLLARETLGEPWRGQITGLFPFLEARGTDAYDATLDPFSVSGKQLDLETTGFQIQPLWVLPAITANLDGLGVLGRDVALHGPIHTRYWSEHRGAAPMQNLPLGVLLRGSLDGRAPVVEAVISNHLSDKTIEGTARLAASSDISFGPQEFPFSLRPGRQHVEPIQLAFTPGASSDRALAVEATYERQTYRDVLMTNDAPYTMALNRNGAQLRVEIRNDSTLHAEGYLDIIVSPAHWTEWGMYPPITVLPSRAAVNVPPFKSQTIIFTVSDPAAVPEACVKLAANGTVQYQFFPTRNDASATVPGDVPPAVDAPVPPPPRRR